MELQVFAGWMAREVARRPVHWFIVLGLALLAPAMAVIWPVGILSAGTSSGLYMGSIVFISSLCGAVLGLLVLSRAEPIWSEFGTLFQASSGLLFLGSTIGICCLAGLVPAFVVGLPLGDLEGTLLCAGHWAVLATFALRLPGGLVGRCIVLTCLGWGIPALLAGAASWERVRWLLSPERHLEATAAAIETSLESLVDTIPLVGWWLAAALLPTRSAIKG
jgi:hypothetical protein